MGLLRFVNCLKLRDSFYFMPYKAGAYLGTQKYNFFMERSERVGFKLKNLEVRRLMAARNSRIGLLLLLRRIGKETYRRLSAGTEAQFNALAAETAAASDAISFSRQGIVNRRSSRFQAYVGRIVVLRNRWTPVLRLGIRSLTHRSQLYPYASRGYGRFDLYHFSRSRRRSRR